MSGMRKRLHNFLDRIIDLPVEVTGCEMTRSNHVRVYIRCGAATKFFIAAGSPSDIRAAKNFRSEVAKWVREKGESNAN